MTTNPLTSSAAGTPSPTSPLTFPLMPRSGDEVLHAYGIGMRAAINKVQDYYDEALALSDSASATYWFAYLGGLRQGLDLMEQLSAKPHAAKP